MPVPLPRRSQGVCASSLSVTSGASVAVSSSQLSARPGRALCGECTARDEDEKIESNKRMSCRDDNNSRDCESDGERRRKEKED